ncbi:MaoC like domain-containing protein [Pseudomonas taetrolens]|uniref:Acyl dehydratase n=1 Tax=Pseudomonas taetrolens TaxID=47884 RepID=A0A0J6GMN6_PSETA|nr:MaoC/PaaZ C-terminal domain-containing protein [Pseudomonas taetrolens]KMM83414.1 acyl dehydratase [Pseudomonas taetrolens]SED53441.1 MaoC like domain-containing protein [Pseudomonas taetrolens]SQF88128.1 MaoC-like dehydratase [Pseudomonas taetrolens]VEH51318.1 MaoC-like dehydratase [Pseudomonas taetrolens]
MSIKWLDLDTPPHLPALYAHAAARRKITGSTLPEQGVRCWVAVAPKPLAAFRDLCGLTPSPLLPPTYPHLLAFGLQMQLLTAKDFPFPLLGLIHLNNRIQLIRPMGGVTELHIGVYARNLQRHPKGATFEVVTEVSDRIGPLWAAESTLLCKGVELPGETLEQPTAAALALTELTRWYVPSGIGRQYAKVSGDYNPIHLSAASAKLFGLPSAIAHGLWIKARALAALDSHLPADNLEICVSFKKPVRLPSEVILLASDPGSRGDFQLNGQGDLVHLTGQWRPLG